MLILGFVLLIQVCGAIWETDFAAQTTNTSVELEFSSFEIVRRGHEEDVSIFILAKQADQLCVNETTVDSDLIFYEFDERLPDLDRLGRVLCHQPFRLANCL